MFGKERFGKVYQVGNNAVVRVRPKGSKFKTVACPLLFYALRFFRVADMVVARGIAVILCICAVGYDEHLHKLKQTAFRPKTVALIAVDLVECFPYRHAAAFEFDMYERETVDKHGNVVTVFVSACIVFVLVDDLQLVGVNVRFVDQRYIFGQTVVPLEIDTAVAFLDFARFFCNALFGVCDMYGKKPFPFVVCKLYAVQNFQLFAQVGDQVGFRMDRQIFISLRF